MEIVLYIVGIIGVVFLYFHLKYYRPLRPKEEGTEYVSIENDGTVWELDDEQIAYLNETFHGADGGRPNIMLTYKKDLGDYGGGFIRRRRQRPLP